MESEVLYQTGTLAALVALQSASLRHCAHICHIPDGGSGIEAVAIYWPIAGFLSS